MFSGTQDTLFTRVLEGLHGRDLHPEMIQGQANKNKDFSQSPGPRTMLRANRPRQAVNMKDRGRVALTIVKMGAIWGNVGRVVISVFGRPPGPRTDQTQRV